METQVKATVKAGKYPNKVMYFDSTAESLELRFRRVRDFTTAIERGIVQDLGMSIEAYLHWKEKHS